MSKKVRVVTRWTAGDAIEAEAYRCAEWLDKMTVMSMLPSFQSGMQEAKDLMIRLAQCCESRQRRVRHFKGIVDGRLREEVDARVVSRTSGLRKRVFELENELRAYRNENEHLAYENAMLRREKQDERGHG